MTSGVFAVSADARGRRQRFLAFAVLMLAVAAAPSARSEELHLLVNGKAIHFDKQQQVEYNESNWGAGLQYDWATRNAPWVSFATAAGFSDSNQNPSYYAGGGFLRRYYFRAGGTRLRVDVGAIGFVMARKDYKNGDPFLGVLPAVSLGTGRVAINVTYIPRVDPKMVPLLFFQLKLKLSNF